MKAILKNSILAVVLVLAFVFTALISIYVSTQVISSVNHSNIELEFLLRDLSSKGYTTHGLALTSSNAVQLWSTDDLYSTLHDKSVTDVYYEQARYDFPFGLHYARVWFSVSDVYYFLIVS